MEKRYSDMTVEELQQEISTLTEKAQKAEQMGIVNEYAVHMRKIAVAKSYMLDPNQFKSGETYTLAEENDTFTISYMNGVFAWGYRNDDSSLEAVPISVLH
ncbi:YfhH family protein [Texcoconibacillus texcoconensis]|uniref:Uncharacterized protein YjaZ n=1 Tax=Texcoconibacillus texcoconensis TaxID=1095777 RepID=A0A840QTD9_9BACI|nr:YfhH family protein [Texcoconibacillus texcoconensis]MBB5174634.1 uncharacterized protein YjaZ [Texcoconibacillus texcoconensis]